MRIQTALEKHLPVGDSNKEFCERCRQVMILDIIATCEGYAFTGNFTYQEIISRIITLVLLSVKT
jgi:hypothetical protein